MVEEIPMQKVNYIARSELLHWIDHQSMFCEIHPRNQMRWGTVTDKQQLIDAANRLKRTTDDHIDLSRVAQCLQSFYTSKMPGGANSCLMRIFALCQKYRVRRYKWECANT